MSSYALVKEDECDTEPIELPTEEDGTLLLSTVTAQYPGASGLKYKTENGTTRGLRLADGALHPPSTGWENISFLCVFPKENKRKYDDDSLENTYAKTKRIESKLICSDLIVLGLPYKMSESELRAYFEKFGEILMVQIKKDNNGQSRGYGFVRFDKYEAQVKVLAQKHMIEGRVCDVKIPNSKEGVLPPSPCKVYVGRLTEEMTATDLKDYFDQFGEVVDVFLPKPYRAFAFVTFSNPQVALNLCGEDHIIKGVSVNISEASAKSNQDKNHMGHDSGSSNKRGRNDDMPNLQSLGLNSSAISPAVLAAALNQAGLGDLIQSIKRGDSSSSSGGGFNYSGGSSGFPSYHSGSSNSRFSDESAQWNRRYNY